MRDVLHRADLIYYFLTWWLFWKGSHALMLLLYSRCVLMVILCLELNYYSLKLKITPICIKLKRTQMSVIYISVYLTKPATWILGTIFNCLYLSLNLLAEGDEKYSLKSMDHRKPDLKYNTKGKQHKGIVLYRVLPMYMSLEWRLLIYKLFVIHSVTHMYPSH